MSAHPRLTLVQPAQKRKRTRRRHGMGAAGVAALLIAQGNACAICRREFRDEPGYRFALDHDHNHCPGKQGCIECVRGALCVYCNNLLRSAKDDPSILRSAIDYLTAEPMPPKGRPVDD
jgi:hypothetical protein